MSLCESATKCRVLLEVSYEHRNEKQSRANKKAITGDRFMNYLEQDKVTLEDAPDGATHWDGSYYYIVNENSHKSSEIWNVISPYKWHESGNLRLNDLIDMRSLDDIRELVSLREQLAQAQDIEEYDAGYLPDNPDQDFCRYILGCAFDFYKSQLTNKTLDKGE